MRSAMTWRSCSGPKMPASATFCDLVRVRVDVAAHHVEFGGAAGDGGDGLVAVGGQEVRDEVGEELLVPLLVLGDPADQALAAPAR